MILLITACDNAQECATAVLQATGVRAQLATDLRMAVSLLRHTEYSTVVIDEAILEASEDKLDALLHNLGSAIPVFVNLGITGRERLLQEIKTALHRADQELLLARKTAQGELTGEFRSDLTGILLTMRQALSSKSLPSEVQQKIETAYELADRMRHRLGSR